MVKQTIINMSEEKPKKKTKKELTGLIEKLSAKKYHNLKIISKSKLDDLERSPEYFKHKWDSEEEESTAAMDFGSLFHNLLLTPKDFNKEFAVEPAVNKRTNEGKAILEEFYIKNEGKIIVTEKDIEDAQVIVNKIKKNPLVASLLKMKHKTEVSMFWENELGIKCKGRLDLLTENDIIVDFKTTTSAKPEDFEKSSYDYGYHKQAAFYTEGFEKITGRKPKAFIFVAIEKKAPFGVCVYVAGEIMLRVGKIEIDNLLRTYNYCLETNNWYGYNGADPTILTLNIPYWIENKYREEIDNG